MHFPRKCYEEWCDEELAVASQKGDASACEVLLDRYKSAVREIARAYFLVGADGDDVIQEGMIGLYKAVLGYDGERDASFGTFASLCIRRQIVSAVRSAARLKNAPLNDYVSLFGGDGEEDVLAKQATPNPEEDFIRQESEQLMREKLNRLLSQFEWQVLGLFLAGKSYREIADTVGKDTKAVDNALSRIRQKLMKENPV
ncbi:MAG: sigma-70 family RNA polymerase sigma factor [Clostridia bacterium]|nr:sigma-70 family RNA polymerase sigma factor [Clostridia bacterium]